MVIYKDHNNLPRFGIIKKVFGKNKVLVRTTYYKKVDQLEMHIKKISLIYRAKENAGHFPLSLDTKSEQRSDVMNKEVNIEEFLSCIQ